MPSSTVSTVDESTVVSSSSPSWPKNTMARIEPSSTSAAATRSAIAGSPTPTIWRRTRAGFASGPRKLNVVGTPI